MNNVTNFGYNTGTFQTAPSAIKPKKPASNICKRCNKQICSCPSGCRCKTPLR